MHYALRSDVRPAALTRHGQADRRAQGLCSRALERIVATSLQTGAEDTIPESLPGGAAPMKRQEGKPWRTRNTRAHDCASVALPKCLH